MQFTQLVLENIGQFRGRVSLDFGAEFNEKTEKPIILFGGKNGAGKTTILKSILLCLYGKQSVGYKTTQKEYEAHIDSFIHNPKGYCDAPNHASIKLEFHFTHARESSLYKIQRFWQRNTKNISESLQISKNGKLLSNLTPLQWQDFIHSIIPLPLSNLFFFDGEKIKYLADTKGHEGLAAAIKDLLGLDLVSQLHNDLVYLQNEDAKKVMPEETQQEIKVVENEIIEINDKIDKLLTEKATLNSSKYQVEKKLSDRERELSNKGGSYAEMREKNIIQHESFMTEIRIREEQLRELAGDSLPFCLVPDLINDIDNHLTEEDHAHDMQILAGFFRNELDPLIQNSLKKDFLTGFGISVGEDVRQSLSKRLADEMKDSYSKKIKSSVCSIVHDFSSEQRQRFRQIKDDKLDSIPLKVKQRSNSIYQMKEDAAKLQEKILKAPAEASIKGLIKEIKKSQAELSKIGHDFGKADEALRSLRFSLQERERYVGKLIQQKTDSEKTNKQFRLIKKTQFVITKYQELLKREKIKLLEDEFVRCWQMLAHKNKFVDKVKIDPESFNVELYNREGHSISKDKLSSGEKQMYAVSILWALGRISGRPLPVIIDTPLGRLDSDHRTHLIERYFPKASHQVIVLSTDTEIDKMYYKELEPSVSQAFHLKYDEETQSTNLSAGYFWA
jgi:DNA sulfur modification protein DndD